MSRISGALLPRLTFSLSNGEHWLDSCRIEKLLRCWKRPRLLYISYEVTTLPCRLDSRRSHVSRVVAQNHKWQQGEKSRKLTTNNPLKLMKVFFEWRWQRKGEWGGVGWPQQSETYQWSSVSSWPLDVFGGHKDFLAQLWCRCLGRTCGTGAEGIMSKHQPANKGVTIKHKTPELPYGCCCPHGSDRSFQVSQNSSDVW